MTWNLHHHTKLLLATAAQSTEVVLLQFESKVKYTKSQKAKSHQKVDKDASVSAYVRAKNDRITVGQGHVCQ